MERLLANENRDNTHSYFNTSCAIRYQSLTGLKIAPEWKIHAEFECFRQVSFSDTYRTKVTTDKVVVIGTTLEGKNIRRFEWNRYDDGEKVNGVTLNPSEVMLISHHLRQYKGLEYSMPAVDLSRKNRSVTMACNIMDFTLSEGIGFKTRRMSTKSHSQLLSLPRMIRAVELLINSDVAGHKKMMIWMTFATSVYDSCVSVYPIFPKIDCDTMKTMLDDTIEIFTDFEDKLELLCNACAFPGETIQTIKELVRTRDDADIQSICSYVNERREIYKSNGILSEVVYLLFMLKRKRNIERRIPNQVFV